jgi:RNA polymerase-binding transcription factor DksA
VTIDPARISATLERERAATLALRAQLRHDLDEMFAAAADVATDDEHDPEGSTIAYERARTQAMLDQADEHLSEIAQALERVATGDYGTCIVCGVPISAERLEARPVVRSCIRCAARR